MICFVSSEIRRENAILRRVGDQSVTAFTNGVGKQWPHDVRFQQNGICLLYREWNRPLHTLNAHQDQKLMFGLLFSLKSLTAKMDPTSADKGNLVVPQLPRQGCSFHSFHTNTYKLSFMESPSGIKIILVTHPRTGDLRELLKYIYNLYVEYVVKNPLYTPGTPIRCDLFDSTLDQYVRGLGEGVKALGKWCF